MGLDDTPKSDSPTSSVNIEQRIAAPQERVSAYVCDFRNSRNWMVGVEEVEPLGEDAYRLKLDTPVGKLEPGVQVTERAERSIRWVYTSTVEGGGQVEVEPADEGCVIHYTGEFRLKSKILGRAARLAGMERFARKNGERSLARLKSLMEAGRY